MTRCCFNRPGFVGIWRIIIFANICLISFAFSSSNLRFKGVELHPKWDQDLDYLREGESALEFNSEPNELRIPASPGLSFTETLTLESWIKPNAWGDGPNYIGTILYKPSIWLFIIDDHPTANDRSIIMQLRHNDGVSHSFAPVGSIVLDEWTHVAASYESTTNQVKMHINGIEQEVSHISPPSGAIRNNSSEGFELGSIPPGTMKFLGVIDEVRIWNQVRSPSEIFHNMSAPLSGDETGLQLYWPMNEGGGDSLHDMSGNGHDIRISGVDWTFGTPFHPTSLGNPNPSPVIPDLPTLSSNYPNPFNPITSIDFTLDQAGDINLTIYDIRGAEITRLASGYHEAGHYKVQFNAEDLSSGTYLYILDTGSFRALKRMVYLK